MLVVTIVLLGLSTVGTAAAALHYFRLAKLDRQRDLEIEERLEETHRLLNIHG